MAPRKKTLSLISHLTICPIIWKRSRLLYLNGLDNWGRVVYKIFEYVVFVSSRNPKKIKEVLNATVRQWDIHAFNIRDRLVCTVYFWNYEAFFFLKKSTNRLETNNVFFFCNKINIRTAIFHPEKKYGLSIEVYRK